jgi:hypothetical protein
MAGEAATRETCAVAATPNIAKHKTTAIHLLA